MYYPIEKIALINKKTVEQILFQYSRINSDNIDNTIKLINNLTDLIKDIDYLKKGDIDDAELASSIDWLDVGYIDDAIETIKTLEEHLEEYKDAYLNSFDYRKLDKKYWTWVAFIN